MKFLRSLLVLFLFVLTVPQVCAADYFRIGTGGLSGGAYFPVGLCLAKAIAQHGIRAIALPSNGSVSNVIGIGEQSIESGLVQADIAAAAYRGNGVFSGKGRVEELRVVANLFPESIHLIVARNSGIRSVDGIKGKRISMDEVGSGTLLVARQLFKAYGIDDSDFTAEYIKPALAADRLAAGTLDGVLVVAGRPLPAFTKIANRGVEIDLVPIDGKGAERFLAANSFFSWDVVAHGAYKGVAETKTVSVNAQLVVHKSVDDMQAYLMARDLDSPKLRAALANQVSGIRLSARSADLARASVPVHPGALRYYAETMGHR